MDVVLARSACRGRALRESVSTDDLSQSLIIRQTVSMREVIERALSLDARPLRALLATSTCKPHVRAPMKHVAALESSPQSPAAVLIAHLRKHTPEHM